MDRHKTLSLPRCVSELLAHVKVSQQPLVQTLDVSNGSASFSLNSGATFQVVVFEGNSTPLWAGMIGPNAGLVLHLFHGCN